MWCDESTTGEIDRHPRDGGVILKQGAEGELSSQVSEEAEGCDDGVCRGVHVSPKGQRYLFALDCGRVKVSKEVCCSWKGSCVRFVLSDCCAG